MSSARGRRIKSIVSTVECRRRRWPRRVFFPCQDRALLPIDGELCIVTRVGIWLLPLCLWRLLEVSWSKRVSIALVLSPTRQPSLVYPLMQVINHLLSSPHKLQIHQRSPILVEMSWRGGEVTIASKKTSGCKGMKEIYEYIYSNIKQ